MLRGPVSDRLPAGFIYQAEKFSKLLRRNLYSKNKDEARKLGLERNLLPEKTGKDA